MEEATSPAPKIFPKFFVGSACLSCGACWKEAPDNFRSHDVQAHAYVHRQPQSEKEFQQCKAAQAICPIGIIGQTES